MMKTCNNFIDINNLCYESTLFHSKYSTINISRQKTSPYRKYFFKIFRFQCDNATAQKSVIETFYSLSHKKSQYLLNYNKICFINQKNFFPTFGMKYFDFTTLHNLINKPDFKSRWEIRDAMNCLFAVAHGMSCLHSHVICHGNLCPSNIVVDELNQCYLCDFGLYPIKKLYPNKNELFCSDFLDPKLGDKSPTFSSDIYSYGILVLKFCLLFYRPQTSESIQDFLANDDVNKYAIFPPFLVDLIQNCINPLEEKRPTFQQIKNFFQSSKAMIGSLSINELYNDFSSLDYAINLAHKDNPYFLCKIGKMFEKRKTPGIALKYFKRAADMNDSEAQYKIGVLLQNANCIEEGAHYLMLSADQGNIHGKAHFGEALMSGRGVRLSKEKGEEYLKKAADLGDSYAQMKYALSIFESESESKKKERIDEGLRYIKLAIDQGDADAHYYYGCVLSEGKVVQKNDEAAMSYFKSAMNLGCEKAIVECADCYMNGRGVKTDTNAAIIYLEIAEQKGSEKAKLILRSLDKSDTEIVKKDDQEKKFGSNESSVKSSPSASQQLRPTEKIQRTDKNDDNSVQILPSVREEDFIYVSDSDSESGDKISLMNSSLMKQEEKEKESNDNAFAQSRQNELSNHPKQSAMHDKTSGIESAKVQQQPLGALPNGSKTLAGTEKSEGRQPLVEQNVSRPPEAGSSGSRQLPANLDADKSRAAGPSESRPPPSSASSNGSVQQPPSRIAPSSSVQSTSTAQPPAAQPCPYGQPAPHKNDAQRSNAKPPSANQQNSTAQHSINSPSVTAQPPPAPSNKQPLSSAAPKNEARQSTAQPPSANQPASAAQPPSAPSNEQPLSSAPTSATSQPEIQLAITAQPPSSPPSHITPSFLKLSPAATKETADASVLASLRAAADRGSKYAQLRFGSLVGDAELGHAYIEIACKSLYPPALFECARDFMSGRGVAKDFAHAAEILEDLIARTGRSTAALACLADCCAEFDAPRAVGYMRELADTADKSMPDVVRKAQLNLGLALFFGFHVGRDVEEAARYMERSGLVEDAKERHAEIRMYFEEDRKSGNQK